MPGTFASLHSKCEKQGACTGPGCSLTRHRYNVMEPRVNTRPTKAERHLARRIAGFEASNSKTVSGQLMHRPGSQNRNS